MALCLINDFFTAVTLVTLSKIYNRTTAVIEQVDCNCAHKSYVHNACQVAAGGAKGGPAISKGGRGPPRPSLRAATATTVHSVYSRTAKTWTTASVYSVQFK